MANRPRILSIAGGLRGLLTARRLRALLIGGGILLFVVAVGVGLLEAPNDKIAFVSDPDVYSGDGTYGIYVMDADGTNRRRLTDATSDSDLAWSPDGERLAFSTGDGAGGDAHIYVMNSDGSGKTRITSTRGSNVEVYLGQPVWSSDGKKIAFYRYVEKVTRSASAAAAGSSAVASPSPVDEKSGILVVDADGTNESNLTHSASFGSPAWSPDGEKIAYVVHHSGSLTSSIYVMNADGSDRRRLTKRLANGFPAWSPDGKKIAFLAENVHRTLDIDVMNADGTGRKHLASGSIALHSPAWSPDGKKIAFTTSRDGNPEIYVMDADGTGKTRITNTRSKSESIVAWSPEGEEILVVADDPPANTDDSEICLIDVDGSGRRCLVDLAEGEIASPGESADPGESASVAWARGR